MEAAAIIATVRATASTAVQARTLCVLWKDAPRDVYLLRDELDICKSFLDSLESGIINSESSFLTNPPHHNHDQRTRDTLRALLSQATEVVRSLGGILAELIGEPEDSGSTASTLQADDTGTSSSVESRRTSDRERLSRRKKLLWLRRMETVTKLRKLLRRTIDHIALHLTMMNMQITAIHARDESSRGVMTSFNKSLEESAVNIVAQLTKTIDSSRVTLEENIQSQIKRRLDESFSAMSARLDNTLEDHRASVKDMIVVANNTGLNGEIASSRVVSYHSLHTENTTRNRPRIPASTRHASGTPGCQCPCHSFPPQPNNKSTNRWELAWLQNVMGSMKVSYHTTTTTPKDFPHQHCRLCSHRQQAQGHSTNVILQWRLPDWLARAIISMYFSHRDRPELLIRVHRIICTESASYSQSIIGRVHANDFEGVKAIVTSCPASIHDVDPTGNTALLFAAGFRQVSTVQFLLQAGADPFHESSGRNTISPVRYTLMMSLRSKMTSTSTPDRDLTPEGQIAAMMPLSTILDEDEYTDLHRIVMGIIPLDLRTALTTTPLFRSQVNSKTTTGLTPLHLAARDCPTGAETELLLAAGADPNATANDGTTPLHAACRGANHEAAAALLAAGASSALTTRAHYIHETPLHAVALSPDGSDSSTIKILDMLLRLGPEHGIDINAADDQGSTPLSIAAEFNRVTVLRYLIAKGAEMDTVDWDGDTPLHNAVTHRAHAAVRLLLGLPLPEDDSSEDRTGCGSTTAGIGIEQRYRAVNHPRRWGILHYLADFGDAEMMDIFTGVRMTGLPDPETFADLQGRTAGQIFEARIANLTRAETVQGEQYQDGDGDGDGDIVKLAVAWADLLQSVNGDDDDDTDSTSSSSNSDDEFFDALVSGV